MPPGLIYLDSNVFAYASLDLGETGSRARQLIKEVQDGIVRAASSALTFDELVWAVKRFRGHEAAVAAGEAFLSLQNLEIIPAEGEVISLALSLIRKYCLDPRDSIHAASALIRGAEAIVSTDKHFDKLQDIRRRGI